MTSTRFIGGLWGTARLDAWLIGTDGQIHDRHSVALNLRDLDEVGKLSQLDALKVRWPDAEKEIWLGGMIASGMGLAHIAHAPCPADLISLNRSVGGIRLGGHVLRLCSGLRDVSGDVMKGEDLGAIAWALDGGEGTLLSVPGRHGKWMEVSNGRIEGFQTAMTAEIGELLAEHSILRDAMATPPRLGQAFTDGIEAGLSLPLTRAVFSARYRAGNEGASFVWGVLIGQDVAHLPRDGRTVCLLGTEWLTDLFRAALNHRGINVAVADYEALTAKGLARLRVLSNPSSMLTA